MFLGKRQVKADGSNSMEDKVCLITGASAGSLGEGISKCLAEAGFQRLVLVARTKEKLEKTAAACRAAGAEEVLVLPKDLSMVESTKQLVKEVEEKFGRENQGLFFIVKKYLPFF